MFCLDLVNCHDLDTEGLRHIVHIFPDLTRIGMLSAPQASWPLAPWPKVCVDSLVEISQLRRLELVGLSRLGTVAVGHAAPLERAIRAQQELGCSQMLDCLSFWMPHNYPCTQVRFRISPSDHQVFSGTAPGLGERLERAIEGD